MWLSQIKMYGTSRGARFLAVVGVCGVKGEATSYLWYVRSLTCALSMHDQVLEVANCFNCVG
jgi:hypothetical protein